MEINLADFILYPKYKYLSWNFFGSSLPQKTWDLIFQNDKIKLNLDNFDFILPDGIIWLNYIILSRSLRSLSTDFILPSNEKQIAYLQYIGFRRYENILKYQIDDEYRWDLLSFSYSTNNYNLQKLKDIVFVRNDNWQKITSNQLPNLRDVIKNRYNLYDGSDEMDQLVKPFIGTLAELLQNIVSHGGDSESNGMGFVALTPPSSKDFALRLCFSDSGKGFKSTLQTKHNLLAISDTDAIIKGILLRHFYKEEGIKGLFPTLGLIFSRKGILCIRSGSSTVKIDFSNTTNQQRYLIGKKDPSESWIKSFAVVRTGCYLPGTHIYVDLK
jgi:hypothetical protein